jgi:competence protein ComEC
MSYHSGSPFVRWRRLLTFLALLAISGTAFAAPIVQPAERVRRNVVVRSEPSTQSTPLDGLNPGEQLDLIREIPRWYQVRLPDGRIGYVSKTWTVVFDIDAADVLRVHFIDVDQGAAALLEFPCGAVLVDAGGRGAAANDHLIAYLHAFFARRTDLGERLAALLITHAHIDHDANLRRVEREFRVGGFIYNGKVDARITAMVQDSVTAQPPIPVVAVTDEQLQTSGTDGFTNAVVDPIDCAQVDPTLRILSGGQRTNPGWKSGEFQNPNNHSLVVRIDYGAASFLITGDLETPAIADLVSRYAGNHLLDVDVFAVGHHGAENGTTPPMLAAMTPAIAIISVGDPNSAGLQMSAWDHGHPRAGMFDILEPAISRQRNPAVDIMVFAAEESQPIPRRVTDAIYATSRDGDVIIGASEQGRLQVRTSR